MKQPQYPVEELVKRLKLIAKKNGDEFKFVIKIDPTGKRILYIFECSESADDHIFVGGVGPTIEDAIAHATENIPDSLEAWGYKE